MYFIASSTKVIREFVCCIICYFVYPPPTSSPAIPIYTSNIHLAFHKKKKNNSVRTNLTSEVYVMHVLIVINVTPPLLLLHTYIN